MLLLCLKGGQRMARPKENTERITVFFPPEAIEKMKEEAKRRGMTVSGYIRFAVLEYLNQTRDK
jgi:hypothetical protein